MSSGPQLGFQHQLMPARSQPGLGLGSPGTLPSTIHRAVALDRSLISDSQPIHG
ncbi:B lymphoid tyrosine kinase, isoform CRA_b [Homo sapiens]|nr:B lymphoid tyrosine kinase, isoform CRA_b [Homo sapiens]